MYVITIDNFEGPMDLLLHLIKQSDLDIYDIKIEVITKQYLDYIQKMEDLNLNIASSYLGMAAELIEIKSSMLLPKPEITDDEYEEDPREKLIRKLVEYQNYKELTGDFKTLEQLRKEYFTKKPSEITEFKTSSNLPDDIVLDDLKEAFKKFLLRVQISKPLNTKITSKEYSISKRSLEIKELLKIKKEVLFDELFEEFNKPYIIISFLSILSLARNNELFIKQDSNFNNIILSGVV